MRIIISPAKKMKDDADFPGDIAIPRFVQKAEDIKALTGLIIFILRSFRTKIHMFL